MDESTDGGESTLGAEPVHGDRPATAPGKVPVSRSGHSNPSVDELDRLLRPAPTPSLVSAVRDRIDRRSSRLERPPEPSFDNDRPVGRTGSRRWTAAVIVAVIAVGGYGGVSAWQRQPAEVTLPRASTITSRGVAAGAAGPDAADAARHGAEVVPVSTEAMSEVIVHVAGAVSRPGVVRVAAEARWNDAIQAAGGPSPDADLDRVGLAAPVVDGTRLYVPRRGEVPPDVVEVAAAVPDPSGTGGPAPAASGRTPPLDLNTATLEQLDTLPGVGPSTAAAIIEFRERTGRFDSVDQLDEVSGIGPARLERLAPLVRV